jgi:thymidylate synthase (FAD)
MRKEIFVLGDKIGSVVLENFSGGDDSVVRAARVSYGKTTTDEERDKKLIAYMLKHKHGSPFEHNLFTFRIKAPILVFRQWHRTRIGVSYNEISARYTEMKDEFYLPTSWRAQDTKNKQGSSDAALPMHVEADASQAIHNHCIESMSLYRHMLKDGISREMARMVLPVNLYSEMFFTCNARSLMAFIALRSDEHAQYETRQYSHAMAWFFGQLMPWTWCAFSENLTPADGYNEMDEAMDRIDAAAGA